MNPIEALNAALEDLQKRCGFLEIRLAVYFATIAQTNYQIIKSEPLGVGVIAALDTWGEIDVYFDRQLWHFRNSQIWKRSSPSDIDRTGIGVLPGLGVSPRIKNFPEARKFAEWQLEPINGARFHASIPQPYLA